MCKKDLFHKKLLLISSHILSQLGLQIEINLLGQNVLPNTKRKQAAEITPGSDGMVPSAAE